MKQIKYIFIFLTMMLVSFVFGSVPNRPDIPAADEDAHRAPHIITEPGAEYSEEFTLFAGCPSVERAQNGRLWAVWFAGGEEESRYNYLAVKTSGDNGKTWSDIKMIVDPGASGAADGFTPERWRTSKIGSVPTKTTDHYIASIGIFWHDPQGRLWLFWGQRKRGMVATWAMFTDDSSSENPKWSQPRFIADGMMATKPTVLSSGQWLLPIQYLLRFVSIPTFSLQEPQEPMKYFDYDAAVIISNDDGKTFEYLGAANVPHEDWRGFTEHMIIELEDNRLWMLLRLHEKAGGYIGESFSDDGGKNWSDVELSSIRHTASRFYVGRLRSGKLLLIKHGQVSNYMSDVAYSAMVADDAEWTLLAEQHIGARPFGYDRHSLMAFISDDEGKTWQGGAMIDERHRTYPDAVEGNNGDIYLVYDSRHSYDGKKGVYLSVFNESGIEDNVSLKLDNIGLHSDITLAGGLNLKRPDMHIEDNEDGVEFIASNGATFIASYGMATKLRKDVSLFVDRSYKALQIPEQLYGRMFIRGSFDGIEATVVKGGMAYVLTPSQKRNKEQSQESVLIEQGFKKMAIAEAALFLPQKTPQRYEPDKDKTIITVYGKKVSHGDVIRLESWGVIVF